MDSTRPITQSKTDLLTPIIEGDIAAAPGSKPAFDVHKLHSIYKGRYMVNGSYDKGRGNEAISQGDTDLVSYGALYIYSRPARAICFRGRSEYVGSSYLL